MLVVRDYRTPVREGAALLFPKCRVSYKAPGIPTTEVIDFQAL
jgi:hypothetical protein